MPQRMMGYTEFRGTPWPPEGATTTMPAAATAPAAPTDGVREAAAGAGVASTTAEAAPAQVTAETVPAVAQAPASEAATSSAPEAAAAPFVPGRRMAGYTEFRGAAWPPAGSGAPAGGAAAAADPAAAPAQGAPAASAAPAVSHPAAEAPAARAVASAAERTVEAQAAPLEAAGATAFVPGRRMAGYTDFRGAAWPPAPASAPAAAGTSAGTPAAPTDPVPATAAVAEPGAHAAPASASPEQAADLRIGAGALDAADAAPDASAAPAATSSPAAPPRTPAPADTTTPAVAPGAFPKAPSASGKAKGAAEADSSLRRRLLATVGGVVVLGLVAVLGARWLMTLPEVAAFVERHPGVPEHGAGTPVGVPAWLAWQHFFNVFLMVLIIRTGLQVRAETRPPANFTPKKPGFFAPPGSAGKKFSLTIWTHQALDVLWVLNGVVFMVLLFATGRWRRLIPTDPETPQHMVSTALQYLSLDWPAHDGWLHYNALQMVAYAGVVFVLAPLAVLTGLRMSSWWPADNAALSRAFPMEVARRVHFPVMLAFVAFIVVHVALVVFSGLLRGLNAMFLARASADLWGLVAFLVAAAVTAAAWVLLKPAFISPVAERFGRVGR